MIRRLTLAAAALILTACGADDPAASVPSGLPVGD